MWNRNLHLVIVQAHWEPQRSLGLLSAKSWFSIRVTEWTSQFPSLCLSPISCKELKNLGLNKFAKFCALPLQWHYTAGKMIALFIVLQCIVDKKLMIGSISGTSFIPSVFDFDIFKSSLSRALYQLKVFEVRIFSHSRMFIEDFITSKLLALGHCHTIRMCIVIAILHMQTDWGTSTRKTGLGSMLKALQSQILYNNSAVMYEVVESLEHGYAP